MFTLHSPSRLFIYILCEVGKFGHSFIVLILVEEAVACVVVLSRF